MTVKNVVLWIKPFPYFRWMEWMVQNDNTVHNFVIRFS